MTVLPFLALRFEQLSSPDGLLRQRSVEVLWEADNLDLIVENLLDSFRASPVSVGLAAVQVGILKRVFVVNTDKSSTSGEVLFINPKVETLSGPNEAGFESCMSMPNLKGRVRRKKKIVISYFDMEKNRRLGHFSGFTARVIQHELDHLDGILCLDHVVPPDIVLPADYLNGDNYPIAPIYQ